MELGRYYSHLVTLGRRNNPSMLEARGDLMRAYAPMYLPFA